MDDRDLAAARSLAEQAARVVGERLRTGWGSAPAREKSRNAADVVTEFDIEAEERLFELLSAFDAGFGFLGEEGGQRGRTDTLWVVDPIDGTAHFARGTPFCSTLIALVDEGEVVVGVIHDFVTGALYSAARGAGATCDGRPIRVSTRELAGAYVGIEMNLDVAGNPELLAALQRQAVTVNTINCGWEFAMTAAGRLDGRIQKDPWGREWDYAAGALLVEEAGGIVANLGRSTYDYRNFDFIAAPPEVFKALTYERGALFPITGPPDS